MKLGIIVVYLVNENTRLILQEHLRRIERHTKTIDYTIYGTIIRTPEPLVAQLRMESHPHMKLYDFASDTASRAGTVVHPDAREHGSYLDKLTKVAFADGCSHICTMDMDSFPIRDDWFHIMSEESAASSSGVVAVFRAENGDTDLTHPCGLLMPITFYEKFSPVFIPPDSFFSSDEFIKYRMETGQRPDTGVGISEIIHRHYLNWTRLKRTNINNDDVLFAGIYGDLIFHFGSTSRNIKYNGADLMNDRLIRTINWIGENLMYFQPGSLLDRLRAWQRNRIGNRKTQTIANIFEAYFSDPDRYLNYLRGNADFSRFIKQHK
jgi:hypothetical protein